MGDVGQYMGRGKSPELVKLNPLQQTSARQSPFWIGGEMVNERVRIEKNIGRRDQVVESHGDSMMPNSSSSASRWSVSQSPLQRRIPADSRAMLCRGCT